MNQAPGMQGTLAKAALLRDLPTDTLAQLAAAARRRTYRKGEVIFHEGDAGDSLYVLQSGQVKVVTDAESGGEALFSLLGPGECFGELSLIDGEPRSATVEALEPVEAVILRRDSFMAVLRAHPETMERVLLSLTGLVRRITEMVGDLAFLDLEGRLAKKLLQLSDDHGQSVGGVIELELPINQEELAAMVGATRSSVNKVLGWYEEQGAIERRGRVLAILNPERLRRRIV
jgi:CRP/FNR family transcriptional regulator, cyclic AMP receptor protein